MLISRDRYKLCQVTHFDTTKIEAFNSAPKQLKKEHLSVEHPEDDKISESQPSKLNISEVADKRKNGRTYFKLAKTTQLFANGEKKAELDHLLSRSHYNRVKNSQADTISTNMSVGKRISFGTSMILA
jgi:hypothetical protein